MKQAVIMVGGQGVRLRPLTNNCPKPILPILDKPCTEYFIDSLSEAGIEEIIIACGYRSQQVKDTLGDGTRQNIKIVYSYEDQPLGTAGALKLIEDQLDDVFIMAYGDNYLEMDYDEFVEMHLNTKADITMALSKTDNPCDFGIVGLDDDKQIVRFKEKPKPEEVFSNLFNAGVYVIDKDVLKCVPKGTMFDISKDLIPLLMNKGGRIIGYDGVNNWMDIGKPDYFLNTNLVMARERYGNHDWSSRSEGSSVDSSYIGNDTYVKGSDMQNSVVSSGSKVEGSVLERTLILGECSIRDCKIHESIVGKNCSIQNCELKNCIIADNVKMSDKKITDQVIE